MSNLLQVLPSQYGVPRRPCFCIEDIVTRLRKRGHKDVPESVAIKGNVNPAEFGDSDVASAYLLLRATVCPIRARTGEWRRVAVGDYDKTIATVDIHDIKKVYDNGKCALDRFSLILNENECFGYASRYHFANVGA